MKRILYVEDSEDTAEAVRIILTTAGFNIEIAPNGKEGIQKTKDHFDLILLDIMLPDMSGWDIYEKVRGKKGTKYAFLSALPISGERMKELKKNGVSDYITKPFVKKDLIKRVKKMLS